MHVANLSWQDSLVFLSFLGSIAGLWLLFNSKQTQAEDLEATERSLFMMTFAYWLVYCVARGILKLELPEWETLLMSLKITGVISYMLTFCCIVSLPLHRLSRQYAK